MQKILSNKNVKKKIGKIKIKKEVKESLKEIIREIIDGESSLDNTEIVVTEILKKVRKEITEDLIEEKDPRDWKCTCGEKMIIKEKLKRNIKGLAFYIIKRRSFYCKKCDKYEQPLDMIMNLPKKYTLTAKKAITLLGQRTNFDETSHFLKELLDLKVCPKTVQNFVEEIGMRIAKNEEKELENSFDENGYIKDYRQCLPKDKKKDIAYMMMDGSMVLTREDGWKEARLGVFFTQKSLCQINEKRREILKKEYVAEHNYKDGALEKFCKKLSLKANELKFQNHKTQAIIADGAKWIWDYASRDHPCCIQIVDYYHAKEYICKAFKSIKFNSEEERKLLDNEVSDWLWEGKIEKIIQFLRKQILTDEVKSCLTYYKNNGQRMRYGKFRELGLEISSGAIESAHKTVIQSRMKQAGMRWSKENVQSMLSLRAKYMSGHWNQIVENYLLAA